MKFTLDNPDGEYVFSDYGDGYLTINENRHEQSLIVFPDEIHTQWPVESVGTLEISHFDLLIERKPDVVILGTGVKQVFPQINLRRELINHKLQLEVMDTSAACRTYNLLVSEGRNVAAAVIVLQPGSESGNALAQ